MSSLKAAISKVKQNISMADILDRYRIEVNRASFITCPFHNEDTPSCKIYHDSYYCWGCGLGGDVISFISRMENVKPIEALKLLDNMFHLNLFETPTIKVYRLQKRHEEEAKQKQEEKERSKSEYLYACNLFKLTTKTIDSEPPFSDKFCKLVNFKNAIEAYLDENLNINTEYKNLYNYISKFI